MDVVTANPDEKFPHRLLHTDWWERTRRNGIFAHDDAGDWEEDDSLLDVPVVAAVVVRIPGEALNRIRASPRCFYSTKCTTRATKNIDACSFDEFFLDSFVTMASFFRDGCRKKDSFFLQLI